MSMSGKDEQHRAAVSRWWRNWFVMFVPLFVTSWIGMHWLGFGPILTILFGLLVAVLLHQRYIKRRSWRVIMWGEHVPGE